jgi:hypothetical protein
MSAEELRSLIDEQRRYFAGEIEASEVSAQLLASLELGYPNWTTSEEGRENSSAEYRRLRMAIYDLLRSGDGGFVLNTSWVLDKAGLILAQLAHVHNVGPLPPKQSRTTIHPQESEEDSWIRHVHGFRIGDRVWPKEGSTMALQRAPQLVVAVVRHPEFGEWLWLADGTSGVHSCAAKWWTTEEPSTEEQARRAQAVAQREEENRNSVRGSMHQIYADMLPSSDQLGWERFSPILPVPADTPSHSVAKCTGFTSCPSPKQGGECGCGTAAK